MTFPESSKDENTFERPASPEKPTEASTWSHNECQSKITETGKWSLVSNRWKRNSGAVGARQNEKWTNNNVEREEDNAAGNAAGVQQVKVVNEWPIPLGDAAEAKTSSDLPVSGKSVPEPKPREPHAPPATGGGRK